MTSEEISPELLKEQGPLLKLEYPSFLHINANIGKNYSGNTDCKNITTTYTPTTPQEIMASKSGPGGKNHVFSLIHTKPKPAEDLSQCR